VSARADHHAPQAGVVTTKSDTTNKYSQLAIVKATRILGTHFIEQLGRIDVGPCIEAAAHQRPHQRKGVASIDVAFRRLPSLKFTLPFDLRIQDGRGRSIQRGTGLYVQWHNSLPSLESNRRRSGTLSMNDILDRSKVA
jgi:hypothetical protein